MEHTHTNKGIALIKISIIFLLGLVNFAFAQEDRASPVMNHVNPSIASIISPHLPTFITMGSSKEDVLAVQGTPKSIRKFDLIGEEIWTYADFSTIKFKENQVYEWDNNGNLKVILLTPRQILENLSNNIQQQIENFASQKDALGNLQHPNFKNLRQDMATLMLVGKAKTLKEAYEQAEKIHAQIDNFSQEKDEDGDLKHPDFEKFRQEMGTIMLINQPKTLEEAYDQAQELREQIDGFASQIEEAGSLEYPNLEKVRQDIGILITAGYAKTLEDAYERTAAPNKNPKMSFSPPGINPLPPTKEPSAIYSTPSIAENSSYYGEISPKTGLPKTTHVRGYFRKDGTYVRGHYRSRR